MHTFRISTALLLALAGSALIAHPLRGQAARDYGGDWEVGAFSGMIDDRPEFEEEAGASHIAHEGMFGVRASRALPTDFFLEAELFYAPMVLAYNAAGQPRQRHSLHAISFLGSVGYTFGAGSRLQWLARGAAGGIRWRGPVSDEVDFIFGAGAGARYFIARGLALRGDLSMYMAPSALSSVRRDLLPGSNSPGAVLWMPAMGAGLSFVF